jgi:hypothetical protein
VTVIDLSSAGDAASDHLAAATLPSVVTFLKSTEAGRRGLVTSASGRTGLLPGTILLAQEATTLVLSPAIAVDQALR